MEITTASVSLSISDGTTMPGYIARPVDSTGNPGLMVLQEAFGVNHHIRDVTERFAREGYTAVAPALFHRTDPSFEGSYTDFGPVLPHMSALTNDGQIADLTAVYEWLKSEAGGSAAKIGAIGYCMGGRSSFLANSALEINAAVSYYGGGIAPSETRPTGDVLSLASQLHAPMMLFWGGKDAHIGPAQRRATEDALIASQKSYIEVVLSEANHGFFCNERESYHPESAKLAWGLTLQFLEAHLK